MKALREKTLQVIMTTLFQEFLKEQLAGNSINFISFWTKLENAYGVNSLINKEIVVNEIDKLSFSTAKLTELNDFLSKFNFIHYYNEYWFKQFCLNDKTFSIDIHFIFRDFTGDDNHQSEA